MEPTPSATLAGSVAPNVKGAAITSAPAATPIPPATSLPPLEER